MKRQLIIGLALTASTITVSAPAQAWPYRNLEVWHTCLAEIVDTDVPYKDFSCGQIIATKDIIACRDAGGRSVRLELDRYASMNGSVKPGPKEAPLLSGQKRLLPSISCRSQSPPNFTTDKRTRAPVSAGHVQSNPYLSLATNDGMK